MFLSHIDVSLSLLKINKHILRRGLKKVKLLKVVILRLQNQESRELLLLTLCYTIFYIVPQVSPLSLSQFILIWTSYSEQKSNTFLLSYILRGYNFCKIKKRLTLDTALLQGYQWIQSKFLHSWWKSATQFQKTRNCIRIKFINPIAY